MILVSVLQNTNFYYYEFSDSNSSQIIIEKRKLKNSLPINFVIDAGPGFLSFKNTISFYLIFYISKLLVFVPLVRMAILDGKFQSDKKVL